MKKLFKLPEWWKAETPVLARFFQLISSAIAALPLYYAALPLEFKTAIPDCYLKYIAIAGGVCAFILQFFNKHLGGSNVSEGITNIQEYR